MAPWLGVFERRRRHSESDPGAVIEDAVAQIILFGVGRYGVGIAQGLRERGCRVVSMDFNPEVVRSGERMGHPVLYGDAEAPELLASLPLAHTQWVVSTVRDLHVNQALIHGLRTLGYGGRIAVTAHGPVEVARLEQVGAHLVLVPYADAAREAADRLLGQASPAMP